jgi:hypothetical protein
MHTRSKAAIAGVVLLALSATAMAGELGVGMKAPALEAAKWFKGKPIKLADGKTINVIEFWATW